MLPEHGRHPGIQAVRHMCVLHFNGGCHPPAAPPFHATEHMIERRLLLDDFCGFRECRFLGEEVASDTTADVWNCTASGESITRCERDRCHRDAVWHTQLEHLPVEDEYAFTGLVKSFN